MKATILFLLCFVYSLLAFNQINQNGLPIIQNYSNDIYGGSEQNWAIVQDHRGFVYVGNNDDGVLEYDGKNWRKISLPNQSIIRSLAVDENNIVFVGAVGEFGYLSPDEKGDLKYVSLTNLLDTAYSFQDIFTILVFHDKICFCAIDAVFVYNYSTLKKQARLPRFSFLSFKAGNEIFTGNYLQGLLQLNADTVIPAKGGEKFIKMNVFSMIPYSGYYNILTGSEGIFKYDPDRKSVV